MGETQYDAVYLPQHVYKYRVRVQSGTWLSSDGIKWHRSYVEPLGQQALMPTEVSQRLYQYAWQLNDPLAWRKEDGWTVAAHLGESGKEP
jgi:hypothetical protein